MLLRNHRWADALRKNIVAREKQRMLALQVAWEREERERQKASAKVTAAIVDQQTRSPYAPTVDSVWTQLVSSYYSARQALAHAVVHGTKAEADYRKAEVQRLAAEIDKVKGLYAGAHCAPPTQWQP